MAENSELQRGIAKLVWEARGMSATGFAYVSAEDMKWANQIIAKIREAVEGASFRPDKIVKEETKRQQKNFGHEPSYEDMVMAGIDSTKQAILKALD